MEIKREHLMGSPVVNKMTGRTGIITDTPDKPSFNFGGFFVTVRYDDNWLEEMEPITDFIPRSYAVNQIKETTVPMLVKLLKLPRCVANQYGHYEN